MWTSIWAYPWDMHEEGIAAALQVYGGPVSGTLKDGRAALEVGERAPA